MSRSVMGSGGAVVGRGGRGERAYIFAWVWASWGMGVGFFSFGSCM